MKTLLNAGTSLAHKFRQDEDGATALAFALGLTVMLGAIGAGMDISVANKSKNMAQHVADAVSLNAAAYIRDHDEPPTSDTDGFQDGKTYDAADLGYDFGGLINGNVTIKVDYDMDNGEAVTQVSGATQTTFTSFFGFDQFAFNSSSTVKFRSNQIQQPVSIAVVADNSGSMHFHDKPTPFNGAGNPIARYDTAPRIDGLKTALTTFRDEVASVGGDSQSPSDAGNRTVRMGLLPYSDEILTNKQVTMTWGYLSDGKITGMEPTAGTDSSPPMSQAEIWMSGEESVHMTETQREPLRYVVFMTDGQNTTQSWDPDDDGEMWRRSCAYNCYAGAAWTEQDRYGNWYWQYPHSTITEWGFTPAQMVGYGYERGDYEVLGDSQTLAACDRMKADGIRIFTIGFALGTGKFFDGKWKPYSSAPDHENRTLAQNYYEHGADSSANANALMANCASEGDFHVADTNTSLEEAFANIGLTIKREVIRLSN